MLIAKKLENMDKQKKIPVILLYFSNLLIKICMGISYKDN